MLARTHAATVLGIDAHPIDVEVDVSLGLFSFNIVGLPDGTIRESRDRITAAINNSGFQFPVRRVVVNLAPAHLKKIGSGFDLPIAVALLSAMGLIPPEEIQNHMIVGELSLDGAIRPIRGTLPIALTTREEGLTGLVLPRVNEAEAAVVPEIKRIPVETLQDVVEYFSGQADLPAQHFEVESLFQKSMEYEEDLKEVKGQEHVKRAMEVAAAGGHNTLLLGPPGSGKTMLARRMRTILPQPSFEEALEITKIQSIVGHVEDGTALIATRPFRFPHHTTSSAGLVGGGSTPLPGEISLAHNGILFLDELPEFPRNILELLRQPLEDRKVVISRASMSLEFPCDFMLVAAMNPCPCGYHGFSQPNAPESKQCQCAPAMVQRYRSKISGPLLDRIDLHLSVPAVDYSELSDLRSGETSAQVRERVMQARAIQAKRFEGSNTRCNATMRRGEVEQFAVPGLPAQRLLEQAMNSMGLSARAYERILKVARTVADLDGSQTVDIPHISEAIQYRSLDRS